MKAAPFAYARPATVEEAVAELVASDGEGKVLAGGQSLVPILAMRLARPTVLVDINAVSGLDGLAVADRCLEVGATVRQRRVERDESVARLVPLLALALPWVGHRELRSRGTVGGSLAHADPAAELPAVACCLGATLVVTGREGARRVGAGEFFAGAMTTAVGPDEVLTAARFPVAEAGDGHGFAEVARRHGDFALAGVAVRVRAGGAATLTAFGVSDRPVTVDATDVVASAPRAAVASARAAVASARAAVEADLAAALAGPVAALTADLVDTGGDSHGSAAYRRRLLAVLAAEQLARAVVDREEHR